MSLEFSDLSLPTNNALEDFRIILLSNFSMKYSIRRLESLLDRKDLILLEFLSLFIKKIYTFSIFLSKDCNKNVMFLILKLSNLSLISLNLKIPNIISIYSYFMFLIDLFCFCRFFITWFLSSTLLRVDL